MATPFAELHGHSNFSFLDGASSADDLVERAVELGLAAVAVTDHQGLYGAVRFMTAAQEAGLHGIVGMEIELLDPAVPDPDGLVVAASRPPRGRRPVPASAGDTWFARSPDDDPQRDVASVSGGRPARPRAQRKRPPGHRDPVREDLRGVGSREMGPHLVLLARDQSGYRSLCRIASAAHLAGTKGVPRFTHALLEQHREGLVALSGCRHGEVARRLLAGDREGAARAAERHAATYGAARGLGAGTGFFLELQHHLLPDDDWLVAETARLAAELGLPVVVTNDVHYARPEDRELQDVLVAIRHGLTLAESAHLRRANGEYHLKSGVQLGALPPAEPETEPLVRRAWAEGMRTAAELAERCRVDLEFEQYRFPGFPVPSEETSFSFLERLCHEGARRRYHPMTPQVVKQLAHELEVIERTGLAEFFLICWDLMRFCRERGIPAQGRGSAGDSIVAYALGITRVDPIRHELLFERFINEGRTTYPDVDIDFATSRREEVIQYVYERYGTEHTGMVCNVVTYRARSAVREVGYALGFPRPLVDRVAKALETYDSVMVRRDLEAEGGFAEFFQAAADPTIEGATAGASPAAGGDLPQAVAAAARTEAARIAEERARGMGFVDRMGQLGHGRGGRLAPGAADDGSGRLIRLEDADRTGLDDRLAPRTTLRRGPSDDEGGPGDTPVSVRWLRAEADVKRLGRGGPARERAPGRSPTGTGRSPTGTGRSPTGTGRSPTGTGTSPTGTGMLPAGVSTRLLDPGEGPAQRSSAHEPEASSTGDRGAPTLEAAPSRPSGSLASAASAAAGRRSSSVTDIGQAKGPVAPDETIARADHLAGASRPRVTGAAERLAADETIARAERHEPAETYRPPVLEHDRRAERSGTIGGRVIDPGTGVLLPAERPNAAERTRRIKETSVGAVVLDPLPPRPSGSTVGLSPWDRWLALCARIDGFPRHLSIHTGGMLVTRSPLVDIAPLERATMPGRVVVQYDKRDVETIKLIKLDLLGLRMLSAIDDAVRDIAVDCGVHVDLDRLPEDIPVVFRMIQAADTVGVFQIESRAQMQTLPKSSPQDLDDLVVEVAIIRPGPIQGNAVHPYLRRKQGVEPVTYLHPSLEPVLRETLGVILYQEQVMRIAIEVAGYSPADSDGFRRAMGTWRSTREMEKLHARFVVGCMETSGLTEEQAEELYRQVAGFASFGFNKSHAAAFARTAYESAFLKLFYPAQLVAGLINAQPMGFYPVEVLVNDAKRHGVAVLPVDINASRFRTTTEWVGLPGTPLPPGCGIDRRPRVVRSSGCVVADARSVAHFAAPTAAGYGIRLGSHLVKGIGETEGEALDAEMAARGPYRSLADVVARTELSEEVVERLIRAGALDSLGQPRRELLWQLREVAGATRGRYDGRTVGSQKAAGRSLDLRLPATEAPDLPPPTELERLGDSYAILSLDARRQVVELFRPALDRLGAVRAAALTDHPPGPIAIGGLVVTRQHPMTARGTVFLALEDETGMVNVTLWPDTWARLRGVVRRHALLYVEGTLQRESSVVNVVAKRVRSLPEAARGSGGPEPPHGVRHLGHAGMRRVG